MEIYAMVSGDSAKDCSPMGKTQKTLTLHDQLCELIQAYADNKGTNFQRVTQAALLKFFFDSTTGPDDAWLGLSIPLEKGDIDLPTVPIKALRDYAKDVAHKLALRKQIGHISDSWQQWADRQIESAYSDAGLWESSTAIFGGGMAGLISFVLSDNLQADLAHLIAPPEVDDDTDAST
jgi:hypothetical protein